MHSKTLTVGKCCVKNDRVREDQNYGAFILIPLIKG